MLNFPATIEIKTKGSVDKAVEQIQSKAYSTELHENGCSIIHLYGMKFDGKKVAAKLVTTTGLNPSKY